MNLGHGKVEKLTTRSKEVVAASERALKVWVDDGGDWREKRGTGEGESEQFKTKTKN